MISPKTIDTLPSGLARSVTWLALGAPILWTQHTDGIFTLAALAVVWLFVTILEYRDRLPLLVPASIDAVLTGVICGVFIESVPLVLGALAVPPFAAGIRGGPRHAVQTIAIQAITLAACAWALHGESALAEGYAIFSWFVVVLGMALVASFIHFTLHTKSSQLTSYEYAQALLRQLVDISDGLEEGLNPVTLAGQVCWTLGTQLPCRVMSLYIPQGGRLAPLVAVPAKADHAALDEIADTAFSTATILVAPPLVAIPLFAGREVTAVVAACLPDGSDSLTAASPSALSKFAQDVYPTTVQLDTALLFATFRDRATAEERRRMAREMHDGIAQDIASLGYLVDSIATHATNELQRERIDILRTRVSAIVGEVRRSLVTLRTEIGESESLGAAIASIARNLANATGVSIHVTSDETTARLLPEVEGELFRIVQESLNNALKHAYASEITVHCQVRAPTARITVTDDGRGLGDPSENSHGLKIMRERADLINASLSISNAAQGGVTVCVEIAANEPPQTGEAAAKGDSAESTKKVGR